MADRSTRRMSLQLGRSPWRSGATTSRWARRCRCLWLRSWRSPRSSSCATSAGGGMKHDDDDGSSSRRPGPACPLWQHLPRPAQNPVLVVCFPDPVRDLLSYAARLYVDHVAQNERRDLGGDEPLVGVRPDAFELYRAS